MKSIFSNHSAIKTLLVSTALISAQAHIAMAQELVLDFSTSTPISFPLGGALLVTETGNLSVSGVGVDAVTTGSVFTTITNHGAINSQLGDAIELGGAIALVNTGWITGDTSALHCSPGSCALNGTEGAPLNSASGTIRGDVFGIQLDGGVITNVVNAGVIEGLVGDGIQVSFNGVSGGTISYFENLSTGVIQGGIGGTFAIRADSIFNFTNAGQIGEDGNGGIWVRSLNPLLPNAALRNFSNEASGTINGHLYGIVVNGDAENINNAGQILVGGAVAATSTAVDIDGSLVGFTNSGIIENTSSNTQSARGVTAATIDGMVNTGTILATNPAASYSTYAIRTEGVGSLGLVNLINSGRIIADIDPLVAPNNSGYAIYESNVSGWGGDTDLTLLNGSVIQGRLFLGSVGTDTIHVENGLNLALTVDDFGTPDMIETNGTLFSTQTSGNSLFIAVADTSVLAAGDNAQSAVSGALSGLAAERLAMDMPEVSRIDYGPLGIYGGEGPTRDWWAKGFGGFGVLRGGGPVAATGYFYGGLATGADFTTNAGMHFGIMAGVSTGQVNVQVDNGQELASNGFFLGGYGRYEAPAFNLDYALTAGYSQNNSTRIVGNNLVIGGLETAVASYDSFYIAPELTIGSENWEIGELGLNPSLRLRYTFMQSEGYTETGLTDGNLTVGTRNTHVIDARAQLAMPVRAFGPDTDFVLRAGLDAHFVMGGSFDATLLGITTADFNAGGASFSAFGFAGIDVEHRLNERSNLFFSAELGLGTETSLAGNIEAGFKMIF